MNEKTYTCVNKIYNSNMNGWECYSKPNTIFLIDTNNIVSVGDTVKLQYNEKNFYEKIWVNGVLKFDKPYRN